MRYRSALVAALAFAACRAAPAARSESQGSDSAPAQAVEPERASRDSVVEFLLTSAATDFHTHRPPDPVRFRDVRLGHVPTSDGRVQYLLCGEFLPAEGGDDAKWTPFATIQTSGYEQWLGAQATGFCRDSSITWDGVADLSASLRRRLDALR